MYMKLVFFFSPSEFSLWMQVVNGVLCDCVK
jgi:hypothetical protein